MIDMLSFLNNIYPTLYIHLKNIENIVKSVSEYIEGNCFTANNTFIYAPDQFPKQLNIYEFGLKCNNILEIGFNAGHSALLMLLANPKLIIDVFDINHHKYTELCFNYLNDKFNGRLISHWGSSVETLSKITESKWDGFHIDGCHLEEVATIDINNVIRLSNPNNLIMIDDTQMIWLKELMFKMIGENKFEQKPHYYPTTRSEHIIGSFVK